MAKLSVNVNKIATIRNARGGDVPNVVQVAKDCERFGAEGITIHPRPDERHITTKDVYDLDKVVTTEYNIEGYPDERFMRLVEETRPTQATLVPDGPDVLTSNAGWDTVKYKDMLTEICSQLAEWGVRSAIFVDTNPSNINGAKEVGVDRIELYTGPYADHYEEDKDAAIKDYISAAKLAHDLGLGINAGHDLSLLNLAFFKQSIPNLAEVSIGHALIADALYLGLETTIKKYLELLK
ncbi:pyridoxine 5'-phosphate synthase [Brumimicrobium oceani]|uniref:Pyridoxine 5'-phosphate synthase n=1 Tax=Brumimicrobium oceani TaxID=2100725 RepID=A0A2U2XBA5_9FLAO|nr:pyridoxine 5'-phosphate synthase [Brumimicrobium oceani]PWH85047.1 pyridoxine 5'-phosphate synthase [Brumimicrobium oceani]